MFSKLIPSAYNKLFIKNCLNEEITVQCRSELDVAPYGYSIGPGSTKETNWPGTGTKVIVTARQTKGVYSYNLSFKTGAGDKDYLEIRNDGAYFNGKIRGSRS